MLVKCKTSGKHSDDLAEAFTIIRRYGMKLNPKKCTFSVASEKFLGFIVSFGGIEANPDKIKALVEIPSPRKHKDVQSLTGRIAALSRFVSKATDKCIPFFNVLRGSQCFEWSVECEEAFQKLKEQLAQAPILAKPMDGEPLYLYLAVTEHAISAALVREDGKTQLSVYYVSKRLLGAESRYLKPESSGRLLTWDMEFIQFDIAYIPRVSIKEQALAEFIVECSRITEGDDPPAPATPVWKVFVDKASNENGAGAGIILVSLQGHQLQDALRFHFKALNNEAEHEAMLAGLRLAREVGAANLEIYSNSQLVIRQVLREYQTKGEKMAAYVTQMREMLQTFKRHSIHQIPREKNVFADTLEKLATDAEMDLSGMVSINHLPIPSIRTSTINTIDHSTSWMGPIIHYLTTGGLPADRAVARKLQYQVHRYVMIDEKLYRRGLYMPYLRLLEPEQHD
ncbi:uncharacterized protein LOC133796014 [Humulus lupulus]|uniref:uncharacterized protein LOC133796014 n=1 Tax=Humulus lupulus TaxID=3486 RepID=UPI002B40C785|nr:uncharacterized protein LOC133796014 [Humulus lupulus]